MHMRWGGATVRVAVKVVHYLLQPATRKRSNILDHIVHHYLQSVVLNDGFSKLKGLQHTPLQLKSKQNIDKWCGQAPRADGMAVDKIN